MSGTLDALLTINRRRILQKLAEHGPCGRAELSRLTGMSKPSVAENISPLLEEGLITEQGEGEAAISGGRRPMLLRFNATYRLTAVLDLSRSQPVVAVGDLLGRMLGKTHLSATVHQVKSKEKLRACTVALGKLMAEQKTAAGPLGAIVLCLPGVYRDDNSMVRVPPQFEPWTSIGLDKDLETLFQAPVVVKNAVSMSALGEYQNGSGQGCRSIAYVSSGMGVGVGLVLNGALYEGVHHAAGELDNIRTRSRLERGISLQEYIGMEALFARVREDIVSGSASSLIARLVGRNAPRLPHLVEAARGGDEYVLDLIREIGRELGYVFSMIMALVDVDRIVTGGEYTVFLPWIQQEADRIIADLFPAPDMRSAALGEDSGVYGGFLFGRRFLFD